MNMAAIFFQVNLERLQPLLLLSDSTFSTGLVASDLMRIISSSSFYRSSRVRTLASPSRERRRRGRRGRGGGTKRGGSKLSSLSEAHQISFSSPHHFYFSFSSFNLEMEQKNRRKNKEDIMTWNLDIRLVFFCGLFPLSSLHGGKKICG